MSNQQHSPVPSPGQPSPDEPNRRSGLSKPVVGVAAGILGLLIGVLLGVTPIAPTAPAPDSAPESEVAAAEERAEAKVAAAQPRAEEELAQVREAGANRLDRVKKAAAAHARTVARQARAAQRAAVDRAVENAVERAVARTVKIERRKANDRVEAARQAAEIQASPPDTGDSETDPIFGTCGEANDNGYGSYVRGVDPEYDWYDDRDSDGVVCEY